MQTNQLQQRIERIEQCADDAVQAVQQAGANAPDELRECISQMHQQARDLRATLQLTSDEVELVDSVDSLEQTGDRAKQVCRNAGDRVAPQLQSAVTKAHDEISSLKKQMH